MNLFENRVAHVLGRAGVHVYRWPCASAKPYDMIVHDPSVFRRIVFEGSIGAGDSYMEGRWDCNDLPELARRIIVQGIPEQLQGVKDAFWQQVFKRLNLQRTHGDHIAEHYNFGNAYYQHVLDPSMTYTCPYWTGKPGETLEEAQFAKHELIARKLKLRPGMRVLDIGCGWGALLAHLSKYYGVVGVGITLSDEQLAFARERARGLPTSVTIRKLNAFDIEKEFREGEFDRIVSVGMAEHVGQQNFSLYFRQYKYALAKDGLALCHSIVGEGGGADPWLSTRIFKGGHIPDALEFRQAMKAEGLAILDVHELESEHYARGLKCWRENQENNWETLRALGYSEQQIRMNRYYFGTCEGAFRSGNLHVDQVVLTHPEAANDNYLDYVPIRHVG